MPETNNLLTRQIPFARTGIFVSAGLIFVFAVFLFGTIVGHYETGPFTLVQPLISPDEPAVIDQQPVSTPPITLEPEDPKLTSNLLNLDITWLPVDLRGPGGGISVYKNSVLVTKDYLGAIWYYDHLKDDYYQLNIFMPWIDHDTFPKRTVDGRQITPLRYNKVHVYERGDVEYMLALYGYYDKANNCRTLRLDRAELPEDWAAKPAASGIGVELNWTTLFTAKPCLQFTGEKDHVTGYQEGAALLQLGDDVLFTTGDMGRDGIWIRKPILTQSEASDFGRVFKLSLENNTIERVASGLRNPQGLTLDSNGRIWGTDQGPMGGDELNLIESGINYGWPFATYGANYVDTNKDQRTWPYIDVLGHHEGYEAPRFQWSPSISPSSITFVEGFHPNWNGNLMVSSLRGGGLVRLTLEGDRVVSQESLLIRKRIRGVLNAHNRLYLLADDGVLGYLTPRATDEVFSPEVEAANNTLRGFGCIECHSNTSSPSLANLFNQQIAAQPGVSYSSALKKHTLQRWDRVNLATFLMSPNEFAQGTSMPNQNLSAEDVEKIIDALDLIALKKR